MILLETCFASCLVPRYCALSKLLWGREAQLSMYINCKMILCNHALICIKVIVVGKQAWLTLVSSLNKLVMAFEFGALNSRLREVNFNWNHPWQFLTHTNFSWADLKTLDSLILMFYFNTSYLWKETFTISAKLFAGLLDSLKYFLMSPL